jgi:hypothetical protein
MGEEIAEQDSIVSDHGDSIYLRSDSHPTANCKIVCLQMFYSDNLIFVHEYAFGYNKSKSDSTLDVDLMIKNKSINGEVSYVC